MGIKTITTVTCDKCKGGVPTGLTVWDFSYYGYIFCNACFIEMSTEELMFNYLHQGEKYKHQMILTEDGDLKRIDDVRNPS